MNVVVRARDEETQAIADKCADPSTEHEKDNFTHVQYSCGGCGQAGLRLRRKCNKCSEYIDKVDPHGFTQGFYGIAIAYSAGETSDVLIDGTEYRFNLCEKCLAEIMKTLAIPADERDYLHG